jgi:upstream activation factor subunit UAF30
MPRQSKSKTEVTETTTAANTSTVNTSTINAATTVPKAPKAKVPKVAATTTATTTATVVPTVTAASTIVPNVDTVSDTAGPTATAADSDVDLAAISTEFLAKLNQLSALIGSLKTEYRSLEKKWTREIKTAQKTNAKRKRKSGNRQPSGFVKPTKISDELAKFLEKPVGSEMARTDVTREINKYIRSHSLQDKENGRKINPDAKLQTLLKLKKTDELTYFNLQRYMSPHFAKSEKALAAAASAASVAGFAATMIA